MLKLAVLFFLSISAQARDFVRELRGLYFDSRPLIERELDGWYVGRCYHAETPALPVISILVGRVEKIVHDAGNGPAFPPRIEHVSEFGIFEDDTVEVLQARIKSRGLTRIRRGGAAWSANLPDAGVTIRLRLYPTTKGVEPYHNPGYQVAKIDPLGDDSGRAGTPSGMCYFYKQVR